MHNSTSNQLMGWRDYIYGWHDVQGNTMPYRTVPEI